jgi:hypothetical protein
MIVDLTLMQSGFCNRLQQVTFCAAVAKLRGESTLWIREIPDIFCPYHFLDLCLLQGLELEPWYPGVGSAEIFLLSRDSPSLHAAALRKPGNLTVSDQALFDLWTDSYRALRPRPEISERVDYSGAGSDCIGLHVRMTDKVNETPSVWEIHPDAVPTVEKRARRIVHAQLRKYSLRKVFLTADEAVAKERWKGLLEEDGVTVLSHPTEFDTSKLRQTGGDDFAVDLFGLARCAALVGTTSSSVTRTAARIGAKSFLIANEMFLGTRTRIAWGNLKRRLVT